MERPSTSPRGEPSARNAPRSESQARNNEQAPSGRCPGGAERIAEIALLLPGAPAASKRERQSTPWRPAFVERQSGVPSTALEGGGEGARAEARDRTRSAAVDQRGDALGASAGAAIRGGVVGRRRRRERVEEWPARARPRRDEEGGGPSGASALLSIREREGAGEIRALSARATKIGTGAALEDRVAVFSTRARRVAGSPRANEPAISVEPKILAPGPGEGDEGSGRSDVGSAWRQRRDDRALLPPRARSAWNRQSGVSGTARDPGALDVRRRFSAVHLANSRPRRSRRRPPPRVGAAAGPAANQVVACTPQSRTGRDGRRPSRGVCRGRKTRFTICSRRRPGSEAWAWAVAASLCADAPRF